jgi:selenocysteine-specific elongation factor
MHVIGTAGHVDHGKTTLVAALTGINPDRLKEEQEREMTIDLGFAWLKLADGEEVGIIDVPGHRDFIENMLAGVGGIDAVLLVIAADEGVMVQTREHLAILDLLHIDHGIIVLNKIDLVEDPSWLDLVEADIQHLLKGTVLQDASIVRVSSKTRAGFPELLQALGAMLHKSPPRPDLDRPRLPVDRVFSIAGFGTVITGTLSDGHLTTGQEVEILPAGLRGRIRALQTHKEKEETAIPGSRTAVNISGLDVEQIHRGDVLTLEKQYHPTRRMDVSFRLLADTAVPLHHHTEVKLYLGTSEIIGDVRLLGTEELKCGETGWLQLELRDPVVAVRGDRFILRRPSPGETIGGGTVVDPHPKRRHKRFDPDLLSSLEKLSQGTPADIIIQSALALGPAFKRDVFIHSGLEPGIAASALTELTTSGQMIAMEEFLITAAQWTLLKSSILENITSYHQTYPLRRGIPREELKSRLKLSPHIFNLITENLASNGSLIESPKWLALPDHRVRFSPFQQVKVDKLLAQFSAAQLAPPSVKECLLEVGEDIFKTLLEFEDLVQVSEDVVFSQSEYNSLVDQVIQELSRKGKITLGEVRDLLTTSRKYVQALMEHLDAKGITIRDGDYRHLNT